MSPETFQRVVDAICAAGHGGDIEWSENAGPPDDAEDFALEAIFVICNSGMKNTVARRIYDRVSGEMLDGGRAFEVFKHPGKAAAIDHIWDRRFVLFETYMAQGTDELRLSFIASLPWIGNITKHHLAKNFGMDVAKPDVHLQRLADYYGETVQGLCDRLAAASSYKSRTVDVLLWRACAIGLIDSKSGEVFA
jgi:hypothetical protein